MNSLRAYIGGRLGPVIAAGLAAALCVGAVVAIGAGLGSGAFDPSGFLGAGMGAQPDPDLSTAYDVEQSETGGEANMDVEEDRADEGPADSGSSTTSPTPKAPTACRRSRWWTAPPTRR